MNPQPIPSPHRTVPRWGRVALVLLAMVAVGGWVVRRPGPVDERLARIRAAGLPSDWSGAEAWYGGTPLEPDATDALIRALEDLQSIDTDRGVPDRGTQWTDEDREWARAQMTRNTGASAALHAALAAGGHRFPLGAMLGSNADMGIQHLMAIKRASQYLAVEAAARAEAGDAPGATESLIAGIRAGRTLDGGPVLIHHLVQIAVHSIQISAAERVLTFTPLPEESLVRLQAAWSGVLATNTLQRVLVGERAYGVSSSRLPIRDLYRSMDMSAAMGVEVPLWERWGKMGLLAAYSASGMKRRDLITYLDHMEALIETAGRGCTPETVAGMAAHRLAADRLAGSWTRPLSSTSLASICGAPPRSFKLTTSLRCALTAVAVERFRRRHDRLPESLDELVPDFLASLPDDPMTGRALAYRRLDPGFLVYGIGEDGVDDGGVEYAARPRGREGGWDVTFTVGR